MVVSPRSTLAILACVAVVCSASAGCATTGATPKPFPRPGGPIETGTTPASPVPPPAAKPGPGSGARTRDLSYEITGTALGLRGAPYRDGGSDPAGFDCSGFVRYVFEQSGVRVPRTVGEQYRAGRQVTGAIEPGDLVFFTTVAPGATHVGISLGGDEFVHAPSGAGKVRVERMSASYWSTRFVGARRVL